MGGEQFLRSSLVCLRMRVLGKRSSNWKLILSARDGYIQRVLSAIRQWDHFNILTSPGSSAGHQLFWQPLRPLSASFVFSADSEAQVL
jgi:hypothetical protein